MAALHWIDVGPNDLVDGELREARARGLMLGLARVGGRLHAFEVWCTHAECPLSDGWLEGGAVRCPCHASLFDLTTGLPLEGPADEPIRIFATRDVQGRVEARLPATDT